MTPGVTPCRPPKASASVAFVSFVAVARARRFANFATRRRFSASTRATSRAGRAWAPRSSSSSSRARLAYFCVPLASLAREAEAPHASERRFFLARSASNSAARASGVLLGAAGGAAGVLEARAEVTVMFAGGVRVRAEFSGLRAGFGEEATGVLSLLARGEGVDGFGALASPLEETTHTGRRLPSISRLIKRHTPMTCARRGEAEEAFGGEGG